MKKTIRNLISKTVLVTVIIASVAILSISNDKEKTIEKCINNGYEQSYCEHNLYGY